MEDADVGETFDASRDLKGEELAGRYVLLQRLSTDGLSSVYQAQDTKLMRRVVVRVPGPDALGESGFGERFRTGLRSISDLQHDALVGVVDFGEHEGVPFAVTHHVAGTSLAKLLEERGQLTASEVAAWLPQIAAALDYIHDQREVHGRIDPDTVLLGAPPSTKAFLADFTVGRALSGRKATPASDQRALGATARACLSEDNTPDRARKVIERALGDKPFESCAAFATALVAALAADASAAAPATGGPMPTRSDSETLGFSRPRPVGQQEESAPAADAAADPHATRQVLMRGRKRSSNSLLLAVLALVVIGAVFFVVAKSGKDSGGGSAAADDVPPAIEIVKPVEGLRIRSTEVAVAGRTDDPKAIVLVDDAPVKVQDDGSFETVTRVPKEGEQVIEVFARDEAGNEARKTVTVNRDGTPPALEITAPTPEALAMPTTAPTVVVQGRVGEAGAMVEVAGEPTAVGEDGTFEREVEIPLDGENRIEIVTRDEVGNEARTLVVALRRLVVCCETLEITAPLDGTATREDEIEVVGLMEDPRASVTIDGEPTVPGRDGVFRGIVKLEQEGEQEITVKAWDSDGHEGAARVRITRDLTPPALTLTSPRTWAGDPTRTFGVSARPLDVSGTVEDATRCCVYVNGVRGSVEDGTWGATVPISVGEKFVRVWAEDAAGNLSEVHRYRVLVPRPTIKGLPYKGLNESGYEEFKLGKDPTITLVLVPEGGYERGAALGDPAARPDEQPRQGVTIGVFLLSTTEVTWAQYLRFCRASNYQLPPGISEAKAKLLLDHPVTQVTWADAQAYCTWAGVRLPSESEWEYATRFGADGSVWPWGATPKGTSANVAGVRGNTTPISTYPATGELALYDIIGNAAEWCADWYLENEYGELPERDPQGPETGTLRVVRGGSWKDPEGRTRISARHAVDPSTRSSTVGFRVAADAK